MATKQAVGKFADHTKYHLAPKGFWKKFRDAVVVNPEISSGIPLVTAHRWPQPGSRPEIYATPATKASDPAQNPYWKRDARRHYPQLSVVTQSHLSQVLLGAPSAEAVAAPADDKSSVPANVSPPAPLELTEAIAKAANSTKAFSSTNLPPAPPFKRWAPKKQEDAPHDPTAYWPMSLYGGSV
ncbi:NADH-ubiquinone oxidoreductase 21,3 kDa subunit [Rhizoctonia solani]|uniref:NADH-ubiquinone oxidoreductase 21,3 kDa subunit n=1 Tax=Rhizoctonia solani TaxID=456999 RepID=A0A8H8NZ13_9AGAM|nr:NADH-ubiquinone oxidoreductase 21,3 kDa subunit [Rhizoctonia solani]QRW21352.1 NADH-ubiquinone oxidoreductase 21,3 kDa subunit [Rhizoctonia solani]